MPIVGGLDICRKQITFDYLDTGAGQVRRGQIAPADRAHLRTCARGWPGSPGATMSRSRWRGAPGGGTWPGSWPEPGSPRIWPSRPTPRHGAARRGRKRHAKTGKTDARHLRLLLAEGRLPECWIPPCHILECRALLELYNDVRRERTAWAQRIHAVLSHQGAPALGEGALRTEKGVAGLRAAAAAHLSRPGSCRSPPPWR